MREPSVVAVDARNDAVIHVGQEAKDVIGRTPGSIMAIRPLKDGVIADFDITASMLHLFIERVVGRNWFSKPRIVICVPSGVTAVEKRAVRDAAQKAGGKYVAIIEEPMAAAIGAGLPVEEAIGSMVVDIGGGTTEVAVISMGGIVASTSIRIAGDEFDKNIIAFIKRKYNLLIGDRTAEIIKIEIGSAHPYEDEQPLEITGRNLMDGFPKSINATPLEIRESMAESIQRILDAIHSTLEQTPPELSADIIDSGITLTGGGAMIKGLDTIISIKTGMPVQIAEDPLDCVALGTGKILDIPFKQKAALFTDERRQN